MARRTVTTTVPAYVARTQLGSLLKQITQRKARFVITKNGKPAAVPLSASDFDDMIEELGPEFQKSLQVVAKEYRAGKPSVSRITSSGGLHHAEPARVCRPALRSGSLPAFGATWKHFVVPKSK